MPPASRQFDLHTCPLHGGGPIMAPCCFTVLIGYQLAARLTDLCICMGVPCDPIVMGSMTVYTGYLQQARIGDPTGHGGVVVQGCPTVIVGG